MAARPAYMLSAPLRPKTEPIVAAGSTVLAAVAMLMLPRAAESASIWGVLAQVFPESASAIFSLAWAGTIGCVAGLTAEAFGQREALRPALRTAIVAALLSPVALAAPLWPALLAAAALVAIPVPIRHRAANNNLPAGDRWTNPFSLAA